MSEDGAALSVPHGGSYLSLCFPEEARHLVAEHIIKQVQPVGARWNVLPSQKIWLRPGRQSDPVATVPKAGGITLARSQQSYQSRQQVRWPPWLWSHQASRRDSYAIAREIQSLIRKSEKN